MTRRDLGKLAILMQTAAAQPAEPNNGDPDLDPVLYTHKLASATTQRLAFRATTRPEAEKWQRDLRAKLVELLGGFPATRSALEPQTLETREFPGYVREKFMFHSRPDTAVVG